MTLLDDDLLQLGFLSYRPRLLRTVAFDGRIQFFDVEPAYAYWLCSVFNSFNPRSQSPLSLYKLMTDSHGDAG